MKLFTKSVFELRFNSYEITKCITLVKAKIKLVEIINRAFYP